ncbi:NVEALA domain-containing protein [uncultured Parabacteroides sp.]|uniref:NVEALA domain-containing protein n=1 Tax=uncultured Parabacteroides sp. TaxID=512312 RepID=UPI00262C8072|nr:NVEALA domain-containing protein [uncultured Parabacteroides sp.]
MGKRIIGVIAFAAIAVAAGWNYQQNTNEVELSDLALRNVEALANGEESGACNWATREVSAGWEAICINGGPGYSCTCGEVKSYY